MHHFTKYSHVIYYHHRYMDSRHITVTHACMVSLFLFYVSPFILHALLLHAYSCIPVTWLFPVTSIDILVIDILVTGHECCWYTMCGTSATGATCKISHLLYIVSRYLVSWYQHNSCPIIVLLVPCTVLVLDTRIMHCSSSWYTV